VDFATRMITMYRKDMITVMMVSEFHADLGGCVCAAKTGSLTTLFEAFPDEVSDSDGPLFAHIGPSSGGTSGHSHSDVGLVCCVSRKRRTTTRR
jgi:hypothetical protein